MDEKTKEVVWNKDNPNSGNLRVDTCGTTIKYSEYGNRDSKQGWEIDHVDPNGGDNLSNLQALQWENNLTKSDGKLNCCKD